MGADDLPVMVVHGDFAEWNVHYDGDRLAGVIDFALTHVDSRPYELAIARAYRAPELVDAYRAELAACGWPLSELEESALRRSTTPFGSAWPLRKWRMACSPGTTTWP